MPLKGSHSATRMNRGFDLLRSKGDESLRERSPRMGKGTEGKTGWIRHQREKRAGHRRRKRWEDRVEGNFFEYSGTRYVSSNAMHFYFYKRMDGWKLSQQNTIFARKGKLNMTWNIINIKIAKKKFSKLNVILRNFIIANLNLKDPRRRSTLTQILLPLQTC